MKNKILKLLLIILCVSALAGIITVIVGFENDLSSKIVMTSIIVLGFSILGFCTATIYEKYNTLSIIGIIFTLITCIYCLLSEWGLLPNIDFDIDATIVLITIAFAHTSLLLLVNPKTSLVNYIRISTIVITLFTYLLMITDILFTTMVSYKVFLVLFILSILGFIVTPILNKLTPKI